MECLTPHQQLSRCNLQFLLLRSTWYGLPTATYIYLRRRGFLHALRDWAGSDLTPSRLAWINQLELDRCNSEQCDHGRLLRILLHAVIMRGAGNVAPAFYSIIRETCVRLYRQFRLHSEHPLSRGLRSSVPTSLIDQFKSV